MLCSICELMFTGRDLSGLHHTSMHSFRQAASSGCYICASIWKGYQDNIGNKDTSASEPQYLRYEFCWSQNNTTAIRPPGAVGRYDRGIFSLERPGIHSLHVQVGGGDQAYRHCVWLYPSQNECKFVFPNNLDILAASTTLTGTTRDPELATGGDTDRSIPSDAEDLQVLRIARAWLRRCNEEHPYCGITHKLLPSWWPKRLLDLTDAQPRLIRTEGEVPKGNYAALSHCWGVNPTFITLTTETLPRFQSGFSTTELPQNFQDAIKITKALGLQYLWIDSLCILQSGEGSDRDWAEHIIDMASVYKHCEINISADRAQNAEVGCFPERLSPLAEHCELDWHGFCPDVMRYTVCSWNASGFGALQSLPIAKRAWVVQERLLAPRILHFGSDQLFWECRDIILASNSVPLGIPLLITDYYGRRAFGVETFPARPSRVADGHTISPPPANDLWRSIVKEYTSCSLTYPNKDKSNAISAIAQQAAMLRRDSYVVGFFRADILWDIVWFVKPEDYSRTKRASNYHRAPTWSWLCMDGPISFRMRWGGQSSLVARLESITMDESNDIFREVQRGAIKINSFLIPAICKKVIDHKERTTMELMEPPLGGNQYLTPDWSIFLWFDDLDLAGEAEMTIDILRIESQSDGLEAGLILSWNDVQKAYNRLGSFIADGQGADELRSKSTTRTRVEIE